MGTLTTKPPKFSLTPGQRKRLEEVEWEFHVRAFGEEMARINFLPLEERKAALARLRQRVRLVKPTDV